MVSEETCSGGFIKILTPGQHFQGKSSHLRRRHCEMSSRTRPGLTIAPGMIRLGPCDSPFISFSNTSFLKVLLCSCVSWTWAGEEYRKIWVCWSQNSHRITLHSYGAFPHKDSGLQTQGASNLLSQDPTLGSQLQSFFYQNKLAISVTGS